MKIIAKIVIRFAVFFILLNLVITGFFASQLPKLKINNEIETFVPINHPARVLNTYLKENFGDNNIMILAIEAKAGTIYQKSILSKVAELTEELELLDNVEEVTSIANVDNILGVEDGMQVDPIFDPMEDINEGVFKHIEEALDSWDFYEGNIINKSDSATTIVVEFPKLAGIETKAVLHEDITKLLSEFSFPEVNIYMAGRPVVEVEMGLNMRGDMKTLIPFVIGIIMVVLFLSFRSTLGVLLPLTCIIMSTVSTMGLMGLLGIELSLMGTIIPVVLIAIGSAYSIHVIHHFFIELHAGMPPQEAIERTFVNVGLSVILAGLTTMAGFGSLVTSSVNPIRDFGVFVAIGTGVALLVALTFIPPILLLLSKIRPSIEIKASTKDSHKGIELIMYKGTHWVLNHHKMVVAVGSVIVVLSIFSSTRVQSFTDMVNAFPPDSKLRIANDWINSNFTGTSEISVIITGEKDSIKKPEVLKQIGNIQRFVEKKYPFINKSISIVDFIKRMNVAMHENNPDFDQIPSSKEMVAQYLLLYSTSGEPDDFDPYVDYDYKEARIRFQSTKSRTLENDWVLQGIMEYAKEHIDPKLKVQVTGQVAVSCTLNELMIAGQINSVIASMGIVLFLMMFIYRSVLGGLLSILPLSLAILINFAIMPLVDIPLDVGTSIIASIAVGVGIDYAIHYVNNARLEAKNHNSLDELYLYIATTSGTAIMFNALAVTFGFLVLTYSNFSPLTRMGSLVALTMVVSAIGSLIFIPAIMKMINPKFIKINSSNLHKGEYYEAN